MNREEMLEFSRTALAEHMGIDAEAVVPDASLRDTLGLDSLDALELVDIVQDQLGCRFEQHEVELLLGATVGDVLDVMEGRLVQAPA